MASPRKGPRVKRLEAIEQQYSDKPVEALIAAVEALDRLQRRAGTEDCALWGLHEEMVALLSAHQLIRRSTPCCKRVSSAASNCYTCGASGKVDGVECQDCNGTGTWQRCWECGGSGRYHRGRCFNCDGVGYKPRRLLQAAVRVEFLIGGKPYFWDLSADDSSLPASRRTAGAIERVGTPIEMPDRERFMAKDLARWTLSRFESGTFRLSGDDLTVLVGIQDGRTATAGQPDREVPDPSGPIGPGPPVRHEVLLPTLPEPGRPIATVATQWFLIALGAGLVLFLSYLLSR